MMHLYVHLPVYLSMQLTIIRRAVTHVLLRVDSEAFDAFSCLEFGLWHLRFDEVPHELLLEQEILHIECLHDSFLSYPEESLLLG